MPEIASRWKRRTTSVVGFLAGVGLFIWGGYVGFGWFGFLNWGWFQQSESELLIERCELLLGRIEELRFLAEAAYAEKKWTYGGMAASLVDEFTFLGCLDRYGRP